MTLFRATLRRLFGVVAKHPRLKRAIVDAAYRVPWLDTRLRHLMHRTEHPEAVLDVDPDRLPEGSRHALARMRSRMPR